MTRGDDRDRNETGQYADRLPPERVLDVFDQHDDLARPLTATDVVDALDVSRRTALNKLNELEAAGVVDSRTVGARARVFWRPIPADAEPRLKRLSNDLGEPITVGETVYEDGDAHPLDTTDARDDSRSPESSVETDESGPEGVANPAGPVDHPGGTDGDERAESAPESVAAVDVGDLGLGPDQQAAVAAMHDYLREHGTAQKSDFIGDVYPEHPADYGSAEGWWNALSTGGTTADDKGALADLIGVEKPDRGATWRWVGDD
jgi:DNA-binding transcriptional ArsR family regulator